VPELRGKLSLERMFMASRWLAAMPTGQRYTMSVGIGHLRQRLWLHPTEHEYLEHSPKALQSRISLFSIVFAADDAGTRVSKCQNELGERVPEIEA
jgi:hypothetical protein